MPGPKRLPLPTRLAAGVGLEVQLTAGAAAAIEGTNTSSSSSSQSNSSSSIHSIIHSRRTHGSSSSDDVRSSSISISGRIIGPAGLNHLLDCNIRLERPISSNNNSIGEEIGEKSRHIGTSRAYAITLMRRGTSSQSAGRL